MTGLVELSSMEKGESQEPGRPRPEWAWVREPSSRTPAGPFGLRHGGCGPSLCLRSRLLSQSPPATLGPELWSPIDHGMQGRRQVPHKCQSAG